MDKRSNVPAIISYLTWVGWFVALIVRDKTDSFTTHHLNQALVINILSIIGGALSGFPLIGGIAAGVIGLAVLVFWIMGIYRAATWRTDPLPVIGEIRLIG